MASRIWSKAGKRISSWGGIADRAGQVAAVVYRLLTERDRLSVGLVEPEQVALVARGRRQMDGVGLQDEGRSLVLRLLGLLGRRAEGDHAARGAVGVSGRALGSERHRRDSGLLGRRGVYRLAVAATAPAAGREVDDRRHDEDRTETGRGEIGRAELAEAAEEARRPGGDARALGRGRSARRRGRLGGWGGRGRGRGRRASAVSRRGNLRQVGLGREQPEVLDQALPERVRLGVVLKLAHGVGPPDRVRLTEHVVAQPHLGIGIGAADLGQRRAGPGAHFVRARSRAGSRCPRSPARLRAGAEASRAVRP